MADILVQRKKSETEWMLSEFFIKGISKGVGLEDQTQSKKVHGETAIPAGVYEIDFTVSNRFSEGFYVDKDGFISKTKDARYNKPHLVLEVLNVPGFSKIRWHWGNTDLDTEGCYLVGSYFANFDVMVNGKKETRKGVAQSKIKYIEVYPQLYQLFLKNQAEGKKTFVEYKDAA